jgi:hypothetical protein
MITFCDYARFALILLCHLTERIEQSASAEELTDMMRARGLYIFRDLRHYQAYSLLCQYPVKRTDCLGSGVIHIVYRRSVDAKPA